MVEKNKKQNRNYVQVLKEIIQTEIKKTVKIELKRILKPLIKEEVRGQINAVLAEHFLGSISKNGGRSLTESIGSSDDDDEDIQTKRRQQKIQAEQRKEQLRKRLLEHMDIDETTAHAIFDDVEVDQVAEPIGGNFTGAYSDTDDDGVDLSLLGIK